MNFGQPNAEIDRKLANGQLLFLALLIPLHSQTIHALNQDTYGHNTSVLPHTQIHSAKHLYQSRQ